MRALLLVVLGGCFVTSGDAPTWRYACTATLRCEDRDDVVRRDLPQCAGDVDEADADAQSACAQLADDLACDGWSCAMRCQWRGPCLEVLP